MPAIIHTGAIGNPVDGVADRTGNDIVCAPGGLSQMHIIKLHSAIGCAVLIPVIQAGKTGMIPGSGTYYFIFNTGIHQSLEKLPSV